MDISQISEIENSAQLISKEFDKVAKLSNSIAKLDPTRQNLSRNELVFESKKVTNLISEHEKLLESFSNFEMDDSIPNPMLNCLMEESFFLPIQSLSRFKATSSEHKTKTESKN